MDAAIDILGITGPIYLAIALGYWLTRRGLFARSDMQVFGKFTIELALPALLFNALSRRSVAEILNWQYLAGYALATLAVVLAAPGMKGPAASPSEKRACDQARSASIAHSTS